MSDLKTSSHQNQILRKVHEKQTDSLRVTPDDISSNIFGETLISDTVPHIRDTFLYGIFTDKHLTDNQLNGTSSVASSHLTVTSGNTSGGQGKLITRRSNQYNLGQAVVAKFSARFTTPNAQSSQLIGLSNAENGFLFGHYLSTNFGILHQIGGKFHIVKMTVTTGSSTNENITITLNGVNKTVAVTNTGSTTQTAWEIAAADYSTLGNIGWRAWAIGADVYFLYNASAAASGSYSITATSAQVTFTTIQTGNAPTTNNFIAQSSWNGDKLDGTGTSGITLDSSKWNFFQIQFQAVVGNINFYVAHQTTGKMILVHTIRWPNSSTSLNLTNSTLPLSIYSKSTEANKTVSTSTAGWGTFNHGPRVIIGNRRGVSVHNASVGTTQIPIMSIRVLPVFLSNTCHAEALLKQLSMSCVGTKPVTVEIYFNSTLNKTANFSEVELNQSIMSKDTSATTFTGGSEKLSFTIEGSGSQIIELNHHELWINRFDIVTVVANTYSGGTSEVSAALNWIELI